jgi:hypothetical protein
LTDGADDAIVVARRSEVHAMLFKTHTAFQEQLEYTKAADGSWTAEFSGAIHVRVGDPSLERCRGLAVDDLDTTLSAWLTAPATPKEDRRGLARRVLTRSRRPGVAASKK